MSTALRFSRFGKFASLAAASGASLYILRDKIKPHLSDRFKTPNSASQQSSDVSAPVACQAKHIDHLPEHIHYLLIGGGTASHSAMRAIRGHDAKAKVIIVSAEDHSPYMRPALSKELWFTEPEMRRNLNFKWYNGKEKSIFFEIDEFYLPLETLVNRENGGVSLVKNIRLTKLDPDDRVAYLENGQTIRYEKCLLAPGGKPKTIPELESAPNDVKKRVVYFRTADDFLRLNEIAGKAKSILVIGGGFLGSELTCALANRDASEKTHKDQKIYQIYPESGNLGKVLPQYLSEWVSKKIENEGANLIPNVEVRQVSMSSDESMQVLLSDGQTLHVDYIVCAVGLEPDVELAKSSGLEVDEKTGGYVVNSELSARTNVWVAGDASCFFDMKLGRRRVEHHDHAVNSGKLAGQNMVGKGKAYTHQSMFWSDLGRDISFEAVGLIDSSLKTVAIFAEPNDPSRTLPTKSEDEHIDLKDDQKASNDIQSEAPPSQSSIEIDQLPVKEIDKESTERDKYDKGVVFYLKDDVIVGVLLWNLFNRLTIAKRVLNEQKKYDDFNEVAKMFNIYLDD